MSQNFDFDCDYINDFNLINHTDLRSSDLTCAECTDIFATTTVYSRDENCTICETCYKQLTPQDAKAYVINYYLKRVLGYAQFPCIYYTACGFLGGIHQLKLHSGKCKRVETVDDLIKYLNPRPVKIKEVTLNSLEYTLKVDFNIEKYIISRYIKTDKIEPKKFQIVCLKEDTQISKYGIIQPLCKLAKEKVSQEWLKIEKCLLNENNEIQIRLTRHGEILKKLKECPICLKHLLWEIKQCENGHPLCVACGNKVTSCPICRVMINAPIVKLQHVLSETEYPCENYDNGCIDLIQAGDRSKHNQVCHFTRIVKCPKCEVSVSELNIYTHFYKEHYTSCEHVKISIYPRDMLGNFCETYRSKAFVVRYDFKHVMKQISFNVEDLTHRQGSNFKYRYKIILHPLPAKGVVPYTNCSGFCNVTSVCIDLSHFYELLPCDQSGTRELYCTCYIFYDKYKQNVEYVKNNDACVKV